MRKVLEGRPRQPRHLAFYVNMMTRLGELDEAENWLRTLKSLMPADPTGAVLELEARLLQARKKDLELATLIRNHACQNLDQMRIAAVLFDRFGLLMEAEQAYRADVARNPNDPAGLVALIEFLARQDRPQEAIDLCEPAIRKWPPQPVALASLAIYRAKSVTELQRRKGGRLAGEVVAQKPDDIFLNMKLAVLRGLQGDYTEAQSIYRRLLGRSGITSRRSTVWPGNWPCAKTTPKRPSN